MAALVGGRGGSRSRLVVCDNQAMAGRSLNARAAVDRQRRAVSIETSALTRLLAEVVLRPPDLRHLDAAFGALSASPLRESSLKMAIGDMFASRCPTCG